jgi:DNA excision repair protein ERCC-4
MGDESVEQFEQRLSIRQRRSVSPVIIVDTREKQPYQFETHIRESLNAGDYSVDGLQDRITIERKSKKDIFSCVGRNRRRFERELTQLAGYDYAAIVIESSIEDLLSAPAFTRVRPKAVVNSLLSWSVKYGIPIFFAGNRKYARGVTYKLLEKFWKQHNGK